MFVPYNNNERTVETSTRRQVRSIFYQFPGVPQRIHRFIWCYDESPVLSTVLIEERKWSRLNQQLEQDLGKTLTSFARGSGQPTPWFRGFQSRLIGWCSWMIIPTFRWSITKRESHAEWIPTVSYILSHQVHCLYPFKLQEQTLHQINCGETPPYPSSHQGNLPEMHSMYIYTHTYNPLINAIFKWVVSVSSPPCAGCRKSLFRSPPSQPDLRRKSVGSLESQCEHSII